MFIKLLYYNRYQETSWTFIANHHPVYDITLKEIFNLLNVLLDTIVHVECIEYYLSYCKFKYN